MIEVTAKLIRGPVYLLGEIVECGISFTHPPSPQHRVSQSNNDAFESLAWASAQIHCQCTTDSKLNRTKTEKKDESNCLINNTTLSVGNHDSGRTEVATKPRILFCDLRLSPGQTKTYIYREKIPGDAPPSYRGQLVKYSYKITIGTQRVNSPVKLLRVSFRVLPVSVPILSDISGLCNDTTEELSPANPFLEIKQKETPFDIALEALQNITARRNPNFYVISNIFGKVARFCLFKPAYKLGEDIIGTFDFTVATVNCVQVSVSLQCEEETSLDENNKQTKISTYSKHHEVCLGLKYTQVILPIPLHVTPAFSTKLVSLKWRLHFEFVTSTNSGLQPPDLDVFDWQAPGELSIETMVWDLPIKLFSTTPILVAQGVQLNNVCKLSIR
ncbi:RAB6A-GEF complex partner protein 2 [Onthophagus taurus]|uniref:RAB6A-GEF complex partner protein 2 n=1 Tax=Onthophagus taurus TaxID=166361 RepID=UPI000C1FEB3F|nr:RAB6A-GEF complex partner protein 2 [Onthophagus taurus]